MKNGRSDILLSRVHQRPGLGRILGIKLEILPTVASLLTFLVVFPVYGDDSFISDLKPTLWLDAGRRDLLTIDNLEHVTSWKDKSGNHNDADIPSEPDGYPVYAHRVTVDGNSALSFDSGYLTLTREINGPNLTVFCVVVPRWNNKLAAILGGASERNGIEFRVGKERSGNVLELLRQNDKSLLSGVGQLPTDRFSVVSLIIDGQPNSESRITFRLDASEDRTANLRPLFQQGFQLIGWADGTDNHFQGYIAEIIVFPYTLALGEILQIERYLGVKYKHPVYSKPVDFQTSNSFWTSFRTFMGWQVPSNAAEFAQTLTINTGALCALYYLFVLGLYGVAPARFAAWHEWIINRGIPFNENISKILAPFLLDTSYCLDAVVRRYRKRARELFDKAPDVKSRPKWVAAPLLLGDELIKDYQPSLARPVAQPYIAGLEELKARLGKSEERWTISIEGPSGVGKSSLAFEIARWASDGRMSYRLASFPMLPVLLELRDPDKSKTVDSAATAQLRSVMNAVKISDRLAQALLTRKRVLAVLDGFSEALQYGSAEMIRPERGSVWTQALVITSRISTNFPDSLVIRPQGLTFSYLDRVLDGMIATSVGPERFKDREREHLRQHVRSLIDSTEDGVEERQLPIIFLKLMINRAHQLLVENKQLDELPATLSEVVTVYTEQLLRDHQDITLAMSHARLAARVCVGKERSPAARSANRYIVKGVPKEELDNFVAAGLMLKSGDKGDPFYKFALDPVAELLDANGLIIDIREERADQPEINDLVERWERIPEDFIRALRRAAAGYRGIVLASQAALALKLWPEENKINTHNNVGFTAYLGNTTSAQSPRSGLEQNSNRSLLETKDQSTGQEPSIPMLPTQTRAVFVSYAHPDNQSTDPQKRWLDRFVEFLQPLVSQEDVLLCSDQDIKIGQNWHDHIQAHLSGAKAAVLLISPAFLASSYIRSSELPAILKNAADKGVRIFPILIAPSLFTRAKYKYPDPKTGPLEFTLSSLQAANPPSKTLIEMTEGEQNRVLLEVAEQLAELLEENRR